MHPDKKVGLALGILLIGIVAALFFRNEPLDADVEAPALANPEALDSRIRHKPHTPYLPDNESGKTTDESIRDAAPQAVQGRAAVPDPIRSQAPGTEKVIPVPVPASDQAGLDAALNSSLPVGRSDSTTATRHAEKTGEIGSAATSAQQVIHEVVTGDTLSSIAEKYLGAHRRFGEIYEANQDILRGPDDLRVGMKLKIPPRIAVSSKPSTAAGTPAESGMRRDARNENPQGSQGDSPKESKPVFVRPKSSPVRLPSRSGRSLSQSTPPGIPSLDGIDPRRDPAIIASRPKSEDQVTSDDGSTEGSKQ